MITRYRIDRDALIGFVEKRVNIKIDRSLITAFLGCITADHTYALVRGDGRQLVVLSGDILITDFSPGTPFRSPWDETMESLSSVDAVVVYTYPNCILCLEESASVIYSVENTSKHFGLCPTCREHVMSRDKAYISAVLTELLRNATVVLKNANLMPDQDTAIAAINGKVQAWVNGILAVLDGPWGEDQIPKESAEIVLGIVENASNQWRNQYE